MKIVVLLAGATAAFPSINQPLINELRRIDEAEREDAERRMSQRGEAMAELAATLPAGGKGHDRAAVLRLSQTMLAAAPPLLADLRSSMALDAKPEPNVFGANVTCHPYAAGVAECGTLPGAPSNRDSEPWRTYSEVHERTY